MVIPNPHNLTPFSSSPLTTTGAKIRVLGVNLPARDQLSLSMSF